jgi:pimeloyl-ACP methyl ester carboxylesterase
MRAAARRSCAGTSGDELAAITAPTLVVAADGDPSTPPPVVEAVAAAIPGARFAVFANGAHLVNVERPAEFNRLLEEYL